MKLLPLSLSSLLLLSVTNSVVFAEPFTLTSKDLKAAEFMPKTFEFNGFGCNGDDLSPHLRWQGAPEGTVAYAITVYDPDAPTGSGWWHWQLVNIPNTVTELKRGIGSADQALIPKGSRQIKNDYGVAAFGGACPPVGHGVHRYQFSVHALSKELDLPDDPSGALTGYMINANSLATSSIETLYKR